MSHHKPHALVLINLGTPSALNKKAIKQFLRSFLMDYRVINLPFLIRWVLVNLLIIPFRAKNTLEAYRTIWMDEGSPLLINSLKLLQKVTEKAPEHVSIHLAMRYGEPNLATVLSQLKEKESITLLPLYPQYAASSTGTAIELALKTLSTWDRIPSIQLIRDFYHDNAYITAMVNHIKPFVQSDTFILFSYHGLPKNHLEKEGCNPVCDNNCPLPRAKEGCYRAQCIETTLLIATRLGLNADQYTTSFQSRLGKTPWIKPYTDEIIQTLRQNNITQLTVVTPSFVADCLETLEEIGEQLKHAWLKQGGTTFTLVPCLNDNTDFVNMLLTV